jgi:hypothetical protein
MSHRKIDFLACKVDVMHRGGHPEVDVGMSLGKPAEPVHQPFGGKIGRGADRQNTGALALYKPLGPHRNPIQRVADHSKIFAAGLGNHQPLALAIEQLDAERALQRLDLMADGALGDAQFFRRPGEALAPRRRLEGFQCVQRGQAAQHSHGFHEKN